LEPHWFSLHSFKSRLCFKYIFFCLLTRLSKPDRTGRSNRLNREPDLCPVRLACKTGLQMNYCKRGRTGLEPGKTDRSRRFSGSVFFEKKSTDQKQKKDIRLSFFHKTKRRKPHSYIIIVVSNSGNRSFSSSMDWSWKHLWYFVLRRRRRNLGRKTNQDLNLYSILK
jgi:hypothetical protein